jgi:hypothetical protein
MMRTKFVGLAVVAACVIGSIVTADASAHEFLATTTGKTTAKIMTNQFVVAGPGGVECHGLHVVEGTVTTTKAQSVEVTIQNTNCTGFGFEAFVSPAHLRFNANNGLVTLLSNVTVSVKIAPCTVTFPSSKNKSLAANLYFNVGKSVELVATVKGITSFGVGAACEYAEESKGFYSGKSLIALENGGTLKWD